VDFGDGRSTTAGHEHLLARAQKVETEVEMVTALVESLADDWFETLNGLRTRGWNTHPSERGSIVDLPMLDAYRRLFDKLADFAELSDPFLAQSSETELD